MANKDQDSSGFGPPVISFLRQAPTSGVPSNSTNTVVADFNSNSSLQMNGWLQSISLLLVVVHVLVDVPNVRSYTVRPANDHDVAWARTILVQQAMNPLSLSTKHLLVACHEEKETSSVLGFGQIRPLDAHCSELASLFVLPEHRGQGVGSGIVRELLRRHVEDNPHSRICLLTLQSTSKFYERFGFREADHEERKRLPTAIQLEYNLGSVLSFVLGNNLACMIEGEASRL